MIKKLIEKKTKYNQVRELKKKLKVINEHFKQTKNFWNGLFLFRL